MDDLEKQNIKIALENKYSSLMKNIVELKDLTRPEAPDSAIGRVSRMDAINNRSINEAALRKKERQLVKIKTALKEIDQDSFGACIKCGKSIPIGRIMLIPESKVCVNCAN